MLLLFIVIEGILLIPEIKDKIRINVKVWRDGGGMATNLTFRKLVNLLVP